MTWQIRSRVYGKGHEEQTQSDVLAGDTIIPLGDVSVFNAAGGQAISLEQVLNYTGTQAGAGGALVGAVVTPTNAPTVALKIGTGLSAGDYNYSLTFYDGAGGETLPGPLSHGVTFGVTVTAPSSAPTAAKASGGSLSDGDYRWEVTFVDSAGGETTPSSLTATLTLGAIAAPSTGPTLLDESPGGNLSAGTYKYKITYVNAAGETLPGPESSPITLAVSHKVLLTNIPVSTDPTITGRWIYRTAANGSTFKFVNNINDNTTTQFHDNVADLLLGATAPTVSTAGGYNRANLTNIAVSPDPNVVSRKLYRCEANGSTFKLVTTIGNNTATSYSDNTADASLGATAPVTNTAYYLQASLSNIPIGPSGTSGRKLYRSTANGSQQKLLATIANNTTTTYTDSTPDGSLGVNAPTTNTSSLTDTRGTVNAGSTSLLVTAVGPFDATGGWAVAGSQYIRYTGKTDTTLTGIPASGIGAIAATLSYGTTVTAAPALTGVSGLARDLIKGSPVNIWVQVDDLAAQAELAARESTADYVSDGIIEHRIVDARRGEDSLRAMCEADLAQFSRPIVTVRYACRDVKTKSGKPIRINLPSPAINRTLTIQEVTIDQIDIAPGFMPRFTVVASSLRFSVEDILRRLASGLDGQ